jgi:hypothetical protein
MAANLHRAHALDRFSLHADVLLEPHIPALKGIRPLLELIHAGIEPSDQGIQIVTLRDL